MKKLNSSLVLGAALMALSGHAVAELRVVVTPTRSEQPASVSPTHVTVVTQDDLEAMGNVSVTDALRSAGAVNVVDLFGDGSRVTADIRGFGATATNNTLVLVDGRVMNNSDLSGVEWSTLSTKDIERIEVIQGSAGALYGDKAVGGVINIITKDPTEFAASAKVGVGSYNRQLVEAQVQGQRDSGLSYRVSAKGLNTDNYRDHNENEYSNVYARTGYAGERAKVYIELQKTKEDLDTPGALLEAEARLNRKQSLANFSNDYSKTETDLFRWVAEGSLTDNVTASLALSNEETESDFRASFRTSAATADNDSERVQKQISPKMQAKYPLGESMVLVTAGADIEKVEYQATFRSSFGNFNKDIERDAEAYYAHAVVPVTSRWSFSAGARKARVDDTNGGRNTKDDATGAELGFNFKASDNARVFIRADQNFRFANLDELSTVNQLKTQEGESFEFGGEFDLGGIAYRSTFYQLLLDNEIIYDPTSGSFGANVNLPETERLGLIFESDIPVTNEIMIKASYQYIDAEITEGANEGKEIAGVPDQLAKLAVDASITEQVKAYVETVFVGNRRLGGDFSNAQRKEASYAVVNANVNYQIDSLKLGLRLNNILNRKYSEFSNFSSVGRAVQPSPEANFWLTAQYEF